MKPKILILLALACLASGCATHRLTYYPHTAYATNSFTSKSGHSFKVIHTTEKDRFHEETESREKSPAPKPDTNGGKAGPAALDPEPGNAAAADQDEFEGTDRAAAKTSIAAASTEDFQNLKALLATLPKDKAMRSHQPPISKDKSSNRISEEMRNVSVDAFLFASKKEEDNDYHIILGNAPKGLFNKFMNVEVSGIPVQGPSRQALISARHEFEAFFTANNALPGTSGYAHYQPPIHVKMSGSLFYDIDHKPGKVGPNKIRPRTSWEIHPVTHVEFEP